VRAAEEAAGREGARVDRAERAVRASMDALGALRAAMEASGRRIGAFASAAVLRRALRRAAAHLVAPGEAREAKPDGDDWRARAQQFAQSHPARPRRYDQLARDETALPQRAPAQLQFWSPAAVYAVHLFTCSACRDAERAGGVNGACEVHVVTTMLSGLHPVAGGIEPRPPPREPGEPPRPRRGDVPAADAALYAADWARQVALGTARMLTRAEVADPEACAQVAGMHIAHKHARALPPHLAAMGTGGAPLDVATLVAHAAAVGRLEGRGFPGGGGRRHHRGRGGARGTACGARRGGAPGARPLQAPTGGPP